MHEILRMCKTKAHWTPRSVVGKLHCVRHSRHSRHATNVNDDESIVGCMLLAAATTPSRRPWHAGIRKIRFLTKLISIFFFVDHSLQYILMSRNVACAVRKIEQRPKTIALNHALMCFCYNTNTNTRARAPNRRHESKFNICWLSCPTRVYNDIVVEMNSRERMGEKISKLHCIVQEQRETATDTIWFVCAFCSPHSFLFFHFLLSHFIAQSLSHFISIHFYFLQFLCSCFRFVAKCFSVSVTPLSPSCWHTHREHKTKTVICGCRLWSRVAEII